MLSFIQFFTLPRQLALFVISLVGIFAFHHWWGFAGSWLPFLIVLVLTIKYFLLGTVNAAIMEMQTGDLAKAQRYLSYTKFPSWLKFGYHGIYYLLKSQFAFQAKDYDQAEALANKALSLDLPDDMAAGMYLELINIYAMRKNVPKVKEYLARAKKLNITMPQMKEQLKQVELMLEGKHEEQQKMMQKPRYSTFSQAPSFMKRGRKK